MSPPDSTLSARGADLASGPNMRDQATQILGKQWHPKTNPDGLVNIGTAENHLMLDDVAEFIKSKDLELNGPLFDYGEGPWGSEKLRTGLANFLKKNFNPLIPINPDDLICSSGCSSLFNMLSIVIGDPGDGVMLTKPSYIAFSEDFGLVGKMKPVFVPFGDEDQFSENSVACYEKTLKEAAEQGTTIKALILCNPHNPLGRCYPPSTLIAIMKFCNQHKIHLLADEIYAQSVYSVSDPQVIPFTSTLSLDWKQHIDPNYFHHVYGMSKDHACGGLRVGCLWSQNSELQRAVIAINGFHWAGQIDQRVAETILEDEAWLDSFLSTSRERLSKANFLAKRLLHEAGIPYAPGANAGFFLWIDLSEWLVVEDGDGDEGWKAEERLMKKFLSEGKVFLTPGSGQASEKPGWFRLVFSHREEVLREGIARFVGCLEKR